MRAEVLQRLVMLAISFFGSALTYPTYLQAYTFSLDSFEITKNASVIFTDSFTDGNPPPAIPLFVSSNFSGGTASYSTLGTFGPESGGKLSIDSSGAVQTFNIGEDAFRLAQRTTLLTAIGANINNGLRNDDTFSVTGIYDLLLPNARERYGIRLSDAAGGEEGSDILALEVTRRVNGSLFIELRDLDDPANTNVLIDSVFLDPSHNQICLRLTRPDATDNSIFGSFAYNDGPGCAAFTSFVNTADIFDGENFTRAQFRVSAVPEPSTLLLLGSGLVWLGVPSFFRRCKN